MKKVYISSNNEKFMTKMTVHGWFCSITKNQARLLNVHTQKPSSRFNTILISQTFGEWRTEISKTTNSFISPINGFKREGIDYRTFIESAEKLSSVQEWSLEWERNRMGQTTMQMTIHPTASKLNEWLKQGSRVNKSLWWWLVTRYLIRNLLRAGSKSKCLLLKVLDDISFDPVERVTKRIFVHRCQWSLIVTFHCELVLINTGFKLWETGWLLLKLSICFLFIGFR